MFLSSFLSCSYEILRPGEMSFCRTPVQIACTAGRRLKTKCGLSSRYPSQREVIPVAECTRNCTSHLQNLKVSKERLSEGNLILLRVGIFENSQSATVCPKHRELLGIYWRSIHRCQHPLHKSRKPGKCDRGVSSQMSKEIKEQWNILVQVGSGKVTAKIIWNNQRKRHVNEFQSFVCQMKSTRRVVRLLNETVLM